PGEDANRYGFTRTFTAGEYRRRDVEQGARGADAGTVGGPVGARDRHERRAHLDLGADVGVDRPDHARRARVELGDARRVVGDAGGGVHLEALGRALDRGGADAGALGDRGGGGARAQPGGGRVGGRRLRPAAPLGVAARADRLGQIVLLAVIAAGAKDRDQRRIAAGAERLEHAVLRAHRARIARVLGRRRLGGRAARQR